MDALKSEFIHPKIEFLGFVPDLSSVLLNADYVLCPIFIGGGMKVKTCESLMYGKNIIATKEAFEGYEVDYTKVGVICNNKEEFINAIKHYCTIKREKFNEYSRECFLKKYSFHATLKELC
jgi:polysaccharide biosynthesis protein PslH